MDQASHSSRVATVAAQAAREELARRGISRQEVSERTGMSSDSVRNILAGEEGSRKGQRKIEAFLRQPFWTAPEVFAQRLPMIEFYGTDIETLTVRELKELWCRVTGRRQVRSNQGLLRSLLLQHFYAARAASNASKPAKKKAHADT